MSNQKIVRIQQIKLNCRNIDEVTGFGVSFETDEEAYSWLAKMSDETRIGGCDHIEVEATVLFDNGGKLTFNPFKADFLATTDFENSISVAILTQLKEPTVRHSTINIKNYILCLEAFIYGITGWVHHANEDIELHKTAVKYYKLLGKIERAKELMGRITSTRLAEIELMDSSKSDGVSVFKGMKRISVSSLKSATEQNLQRRGLGTEPLALTCRDAIIGVMISKEDYEELAKYRRQTH